MSHNITKVTPEHDFQAQKHALPSVMSRSHNIYPGILRCYVTHGPTLSRRTGVLVAGLSRQRLRQQMVQVAAGRGQPFYLRHASPAHLARRLILDEAEVQRAAIAEVKPRPHDRGV